MIHLDTNVVIALLADRSRSIRARFEGTQAARIPIGLSVIAYHELMYGAACSDVRGRNEKGIAFFIANGPLVLLAFQDADAREAADIRAHLRRAGTPIGNFDLLIAAQARRAGAALVTNNRREFDRVPGLIVTDWAA